jgi:hypothetical protein
MIKCVFYKNGKCIQSLEGLNSDCEICPDNKNHDKCALECDCEYETCNIGDIVEDG